MIGTETLTNQTQCLEEALHAALVPPNDSALASAQKRLEYPPLNRADRVSDVRHTAAEHLVTAGKFDIRFPVVFASDRPLHRFSFLT